MGAGTSGKSQKGSEPPSQRSRPMIFKFEIEPVCTSSDFRFTFVVPVLSAAYCGQLGLDMRPCLKDYNNRNVNLSNCSLKRRVR